MLWHSSKTANIILPGLVIKQRWTTLRLQAIGLVPVGYSTWVRWVVSTNIMHSSMPNGHMYVVYTLDRRRNTTSKFCRNDVVFESWDRRRYATLNQRRPRRNSNVDFTSNLRCIHVESTSKHDVEIVLKWRWIWKLRSTSICWRWINVVFNEISTSILRRFCVAYTLDRRRNTTSKLCWNYVGFESWDRRRYVDVESPSASTIFRRWFGVELCVAYTMDRRWNRFFCEMT